MDGIFGLVTLAICLTPIIAAPSCTTPAQSSLHSQWLEVIQQDSTHESLYIIDVFRNMIAGDLDKSDAPNEIHLYGNQDGNHCNSSHIEDAAKTSSGSIQDRSYCPWYNIINHSTMRYPQDLIESRCRCKYGAGIGSRTICESVFYHVRVLRKTSQCDARGFYLYNPGWQRLSVGCTMAHAL